MFNKRERFRRTVRPTTKATLLAALLVLAACGSDDTTAPLTTTGASNTVSADSPVATTAPTADSTLPSTDGSTATTHISTEASGEVGATVPVTMDAVLTTAFPLSSAFAPEMVGVAGGFFTRNGVEVDLEPGRGSAQALQQIIAGQVTMTAAGGTDLGLAVYSQSAPLIAVGTKKHENAFFLISPGDEPIAGPEELRGETVGVVSVGGTTEQLLHLYLSSGGVDLDEVTRVVVPNTPASVTSAERGQIRAFIGSVEAVAAIEAEGMNVSLIDLDEVVPTPGQVFLVSKDTAANDRDTVTAMLAGFRDVFAFLFEDGADGDWSETIALIKEGYPDVVTDEQVFTDQLNAQYTAWFGDPAEPIDLTISVERIDSLVTLMKAAGLMPDDAQASELYTNALLPGSR
ncbi:MAG: ABC transporter substrate-binding protein [Acidimicrobiia bacterium]